MLVCTKCKSTNVGIDAYVDPNTNKVISTFNVAWCFRCDDEVVLVEESLVSLSITTKQFDLLVELAEDAAFRQGASADVSLLQLINQLKSQE